MSQIVPASMGQVSSVFANQDVNDDLSSGIQSSFGLMGYKGKVWSIRYRGEETKLMRDDGDGARGSIEVVILKSSTQVSKIYYESGYVEGSTAAPDCFSNNGIVPEPSSAKKQCDTCALCPHNQWGSRTSATGKAGKACSDSKRLAIVPNGDILNEAFGGPLLLRVPAASLQDLASYGQKMKQLGYPYFSVVTRVSFDAQEAYPKFVFGAIRPLNDEEAQQVMSLRDGHMVERILNENEFAANAAQPTQQEQVQQAFEQPPEEKKPETKAETKAEPETTGFGKAAPAPVEDKAETKAETKAEEKPKEEPKPEVKSETKATGFGKAAPAPVEEKAEAKAETANEVTNEVTQEASGDEGDGNKSSFEGNLDDMLAELLP